MRWRSVIYLCGSVLLYLAFAMLIPLLMAMWDRDLERIAISKAVVLTIITAWMLLYCGKAPKDLTIRESFAAVTFVWVVASFFSALPFYFSGVTPTMTDAFFEAASGLTTTGATVLADVEILSRSILIWRALLHWLGGMGIVVLFVAVFPRLGVSAGYLLQAEAPGPVTTAVTPRIAHTAKILWLIYIALTTAQTVILNALGMPIFDAVAHSFATMATGGFSTKNASISAYANPAVEWVVILFMLLAGGNFILYYYLLSGRIKQVLRDSETRFYLFVVTAAAVVIALTVMPLYPDVPCAFRHALFQVVSIVTTTGFYSADFELWPVFAQAVLFFLMFTGGCGGSTGGGIKQIRLLVLGKYVVREAKKAGRPWEVLSIKIGQMPLAVDMINRIVAFVLLYLFIFSVSVLYLTHLGYDLPTSLSAVASAQGNIGPGLGVVGPTKSYFPLAQSAKGWLAGLMIIGRLEIFTVFAFMLPQTWLWEKARRTGSGHFRHL